LGTPAHGLGTAPHITASLFTASISPPGPQITLQVQNAQVGGDTLDLLPRASGPAWQVQSNLTSQGAAPGALVLADARFSSSNITFTLNSNGGPINSYRVFIDKDNNPATGYQHSGLGAIGADYMIEDGKLYTFSGGTQTTWGWTLASNNATDSGYGTSQLV